MCMCVCVCVCGCLCVCVVQAWCYGSVAEVGAPAAGGRPDPRRLGRSGYRSVCMCVCVCARACMRACAYARVRACVHVCASASGTRMKGNCGFAGVVVVCV